MNKKEVLEIRKQFTPDNCNITKIAACYVNHEKEMELETTQTFLSLPEEEMFKYFELFKKSMSGQIGKNLFGIPFVSNDTSYQKNIESIRKNRLGNKEVLSTFFERVVETYENPGNYLIVLIHGVYDVPKKTQNSIAADDISDEVYDYILCNICPVDLSKPGLSYNPKENQIQDRIRDWVVGMPTDGFLYPAFNDRAEDVNEILYYTKKNSDIQVAFQELIAGQVRPFSREEEKEKFDRLMKEVPYDAMVNLQELVVEKSAESEQEEDLNVSCDELAGVLEKCGCNKDQVETLKNQYKSEFGSVRELSLKSLADTKTFVLNCGNVAVKVPAEDSDKVTVREVDGRKCIVIPVDTNLGDVSGITTRL